MDMKRMIKGCIGVLMSCVLCGAVLCGCGDTSSREQMEQAVQPKSVDEIYTEAAALTDAVMSELDDSYVLNYYGIDTSEFSESVFARADDPQQADTIIIVRSDDESKLNDCVKAVNTVLEQRKAELNNYNLPDEAKLVDKAACEVDGNLMYAVVADNADDIVQVIKAGE
jgi:hypothetical protein